MVDKSKTIQQFTTQELRQLIDRLRSEREVQSLISELKRSSGESWNYDYPPVIDTITPINQLYHHGIKGMKWGIRKKKPTIQKSKKPPSKPPSSEEYKESRALKAKGS